MNIHITHVASCALCAIPSLIYAADAKPVQQERLNFLFITADDLNWSTINLFGCPTPDLTPNIDALAHSGIYFEHGHVTTAVSQVSRGVLATGLYPHNSGIEGFYHTDKDIPTLQELLKEKGYNIGIMNKVEHSSPKTDTPWDVKNSSGMGRDCGLFAKQLREFIEQAQKEGKPFYFMANSQDPHRPFEGSPLAKKKWPEHNFTYPSRTYKPNEVWVPGFLPDLPNIRRELAFYYNSVKRLDDCVGGLMKVLCKMGVEDKTVVVFLSDNGMSMPFAKTCCYLNSTRTPLIVRWPGVVKPGSMDKTHFVSGIDYVPTILDMAGIPVPDGLDGHSFVPLLRGKEQENRNMVFTEYMDTYGGGRYPMRAVQDKKWGYIFNPWSDGERVFHNEAQSGYTWKTMVEEAKTNKDMKRRTDFLTYRVVEEFYDLENDPDALYNLINDPMYAKVVEKYRKIMEQHMLETNDPVIEAFKVKHDPAALKRYMKKQIPLGRKAEITIMKENL